MHTLVDEIGGGRAGNFHRLRILFAANFPASKVSSRLPAAKTRGSQ